MSENKDIEEVEKEIVEEQRDTLGLKSDVI
jgi:hypothetical protein